MDRAYMYSILLAAGLVNSAWAHNNSNVFSEIMLYILRIIFQQSSRILRTRVFLGGVFFTRCTIFHEYARCCNGEHRTATSTRLGWLFEYMV